MKPPIERALSVLKTAAEGESACIVLNAANDTAVHAYLEGQLAFGDIPRLIRDTLEHATPVAHPNLDEILALDAWARATTSEHIAHPTTCAAPLEAGRVTHRLDP